MPKPGEGEGPAPVLRPSLAPQTIEREMLQPYFPVAELGASVSALWSLPHGHGSDQTLLAYRDPHNKKQLRWPCSRSVSRCQLL